MPQYLRTAAEEARRQQRQARLSAERAALAMLRAARPQGPRMALDQTLTLVLPLWPVGLTPNEHRGAWEPFWGLVGRYRKQVEDAVLKRYPAGVPRFGTARIFLRIEFCTGRTMLDYDNCVGAFKAGQDGLVDAGLLPNDNAHHLRSAGCEPVRHIRGHGCAGRVIVVLKEVAPWPISAATLSRR